ncbi:ribbon-helix-helix domain-containing protein [Minwuia sp.]|uniref:ribbon-helix-helix domain-containing protein n=1 Tax=Minwuia sp. TaxID=2493630 RepID=UPI003A8D5E48
MTVTVRIPEDVADELRALVRSGEFSSVEQALRGAMKALRSGDEPAGLADIKAKIDASLDDPRPSLSSAEVRDHLDNLYEKFRPNPSA